MKTNWDLEKYFYTDINCKEFNTDIEVYKDLSDKYIEHFKNNSLKNASIDDILTMFEMNNEIEKVLYKLWLYISFRNTLNTQDQEVLKKKAELTNLYMDISQRSLFITEDIKELGYDKLIEYSNDNRLINYKNYLVQLANSIKFMLPMEIENVILSKDNTGSTILSNIRGELTNSFMFEYRDEYLNDSEISAKLLDIDEQVRKEAFLSIRKVYSNKQNQIVLGNIYKGIVKDKVLEDKMRGIEYVMQTRNISEELSKETVDTLIDTVKHSYPIYHKYLKLKALALGKEKLQEWDRHAPYINSNIPKYPIDEGMKLYLNIIKDFDTDFYTYSKEMFDEGRVDIYPSNGKRGGAYAHYTKYTPSFVMLNYTETLNDVLTLAHELGHAIHGELAKCQESVVYKSPLSLAETASIFNETLLFDKLLGHAKDDDKIAMLIERLDAVFGTVFRQIMYTMFEQEVHENFRNNIDMNYTDFNKLWDKYSKQLYGDSITYTTLPEENSVWSAIPHIFETPFYCYTYAFGNILSLAIYEKCKEDKEFKNVYKDILKSGGSIPTEELLLSNGIDVTKPEFYSMGMKSIENLVSELETLVTL